MSVLFKPSGMLDISTDASDLPETGNGHDISSDAMVRCKNLRINQKGVAKLRDGSSKVNTTAIDAKIWWIEEQGGIRYVFAGDKIYRNETSIASGLTEAQWSAIKASSFSDSTEQIYAINGTDRKRIEGSTVREWGIAAPTTAPTLSIGAGTGLTGEYNAVYTYCRKVDGTLVAESNPSPASDTTIILTNQSLSVDVTQPTDAQVTHIRLYRTTAGGSEYFLDREIEVGTEYEYGYTHDWELSDEYLEDDGFKFTTTDDAHSTEDCYSWELVYETHDTSDTGGTSGTQVNFLDWWTSFHNHYYTP